MLAPVRAKWRELKKLPPGERFQAFHRQEQHAPIAVRAAYLGVAVVSLGIGIVLAFIPGPAVVFFGLTAALLAAQSSFVARLLDRAELKGRELWRSFQRWRRKRRRAPPRISRTG